MVDELVEAKPLGQAVQNGRYVDAGIADARFSACDRGVNSDSREQFTFFHGTPGLYFAAQWIEEQGQKQAHWAGVDSAMAQQRGVVWAGSHGRID